MNNKAEFRYDNDDLMWLIYHIDSDHRIQQMSFSAGMAWEL
jgi:hypothetical protein